jgi:3,8-divinyl chlorophyllide a/chlorophyllide a reductase subunit Y
MQARMSDTLVISSRHGVDRDRPTMRLAVQMAPAAQQPAAAEGVAAAHGDGIGCHAGKDEMRRAAEAAGKSETLALCQGLPVGPHDQPQSMCPAFGSLRVGLRMRRTATILSGSACCVYGLTFTSHFYGARRSVGYVPFNSETLVTGKLFEDIREAVFKLADPALYDAIVITNLCVPTLRACRCSCCPRRSTACASSASTCPASACPPMPRRRTCSPARC